VEQFVAAGYDLQAAAILLCESDGTAEEVDEEIARMKAVLSQAGATRMTVSRDEPERLRFWSGRKAAFPAVGRISPDYYCMDGTIPRKRLGEVLRFIAAMEKKYALRCPNVFHAGDGNLHPLILFDANDAGELHRTELFAAEVLEKCVEVGGTITGEHGVGVEKINQMCVQFRPDELELFQSIKRVFDARGLLNPGKAVPTLARCAEYGRLRGRGGVAAAHPDLPRF
jgi:glycolate oxidase